MSNKQREFMMYLQQYNEPICIVEAVRVGVQVFELSAHEARSVCDCLGI